METELANKERETAEKCAEIANDHYDHCNPAMGSHVYNDDIAQRTINHFNLNKQEGE